MLPFFRKIRYRLAEDNQFLKYSRYAIGEIFLVVIGILIALYINNWNEDRKGDENTKLLFKEVGDELLQNIKSIDRIIDIYIVKDSLYFEVLKKNVDHEDYKNSLFLSSFPNWWNRTSLVDEDFKELLSRKENLTELQDSIFSELKELYSKRKVNTDYDDETIRNTQHNFREKMVNELGGKPVKY